MTPEKDEQDLVKALDNVADAAASVGGVPASDSSTATATLDPPVSAGAVASPFPPITPVPDADSAGSTASSYLAPDPQPMSDFSASEDTALTDNSSDLSTPSVVADEDNGPLASIKKDALVELRPLVDKLNVSPEEKFDTYLLLIRSTDDADLIAPAHEAAKAITDETRRAEALLDIIKEIDYLSHQKDKES